jgi:hypothetical protein
VVGGRTAIGEVGSCDSSRIYNGSRITDDVGMTNLVRPNLHSGYLGCFLPPGEMLALGRQLMTICRMPAKLSGAFKKVLSSSQLLSKQPRR